MFQTRHATANYNGQPDINANIVLDGFTIQNGFSSGPESASGGVIIGVSNSLVKNCIIQNNNSYQGGGMYLEGGLVTETQIINNTASFAGGGLVFIDRGINGFAGGNLYELFGC